MSDSIERLYASLMTARDLDPAHSRTARLFRRGPSQMAKKLVEEAIEAGLDAVHGDREAVVRESADLLYHLTVIWTACGIRPADVWTEMARREAMMGLAEKLPKGRDKGQANVCAQGQEKVCAASLVPSLGDDSATGGNAAAAAPAALVSANLVSTMAPSSSEAKMPSAPRKRHASRPAPVGLEPRGRRSPHA